MLLYFNGPGRYFLQWTFSLKKSIEKQSDSRESSEYSSDSIESIEKSRDSKDSIEWVEGGGVTK